MSLAIVLALAIVIAGIAYTRSYRSARESSSSHAGWYVLGLLASLSIGLWWSGAAGDESSAYGFGLALALALVVMLIVGLASAIGRVMRKRKECKGASRNQ